MLEAVEHALREGNGTCRIDVIGQGSHGYSTRFMCQRCERTFEPVRPIMFSFNHPIGACPECKGFGNILRYDEELVVPNRNASLAEGAIEPWMKPGTDWWHKQMLLAMKRRKISVTTPYAKLSEAERTLLWKGGWRFEGMDQILTHLEHKRYKLHVRVFLSRYRSPFSCPSCHGTRLQTSGVGGQNQRTRYS